VTLRLVSVIWFLTTVVGCGHMAPYSEAPLGYVELYPGVEHHRQLRVPYNVRRYEPFPRNYPSSRWIGVDGVGDETSVNSDERGCPEGAKGDSSGYATRGQITLTTDSAILNLEQRKGECRNPVDAVWCPYQFNGTYRLLRPQQTPIQAANAEAEAAAAATDTTVRYCKPVVGPHRQ